MSKQIDERVVSMQFDNQRFEKNVSTSMSTLDKLKSKLNLTGAHKGLENVQSAAKKVDMTGLANNVETVRTRFSALEVMGVTALANITNSAVNAGKKMISALTIDPIKTGFQEYETQINAVQTILANTSSKGTTIDDVNVALEELNKYADMTIYNFTEMTRNIGTFTAAGIDLDTSVNAIQGIANLAAVSGSTSQQASTAMYQLSQALSTGTVKLMDWNSVVNAGMGGQVFQDALKQTSKELGTGAEAAIKAQGSFRESLKTGWLTADVLTETLKKFTSSGANEYVAEYTGLSVDAVQAALDTAEATYGEADAIKYASKALAEKSGKNADEIADMLNFAKTATDAATKVKTFTQLFDVLKEAAQSGWSQTWKIIIGDFEEAKALLTPLADFFTGIINKMSDFRNAILKSALATSLSDMFKGLDAKIKLILKPINSVSEAVGKVAGTLKDYDTLVDEIIAGKWGNAPTRWQDLTKAGYDWAHAQNLVNERLGCSVRHTTNYTESQKKQTKVTQNLTEADAKLLDELAKLNDEQLRAKGYSPEQIKALREIQALAEKLGLSISDLVTKSDEINGRWLMIEGFKNIGKSLVAIFTAIGDAWKEIFTGFNVDNLANGLFNLIAAFHRFSVRLKENVGDAENFKRTFKGIFALLDIILTIVGGPIKIAFKILSQVLSAFNLNIFDITAIIGDVIVGFREWLYGVLDFTKIFKKLVPYIKKATSAIKDWVDKTKPLEKMAAVFKKLGSAIKEWAIAFKDSEFFETGKNIILGLVQGLKNGAKSLWDILANVLHELIERAKNILGIHSPSLVFAAIGGFIIAGLLLGLKNGFPEVADTITGFFGKIISTIKQIDWGAILAAVTSIGLVLASNKMASAFASFASMFEGIGDFLEGLGIGLKRLFTGIGKYFKAKAWEARSKAILNFAIAVGILAASVYVLAQLDAGSLWSAIGAIGVLSLILVGLSIAISKLNGLDSAKLDKTGLDIKKAVSNIIPIAVSLLLVASALKKLAGLSVGDLIKGGIAVAALGGILVGLMAATKLVGPSFDTTGATLIKISSAILLLVFVVKQIAKLDGTDLAKGISVMVLFGAFIVGLIAATKLAGPNINGLGSTILKISASILLLVFVARLIGSMDPAALAKGMVAIIAFGAIIAGLIFITRIAGGAGIAKVGSTMIGISVAMLIMAGTTALIGSLDPGTLMKGLIAIKIFSMIISRLIMSVGIFGKQVKGLAATILAISVAIGILAGVSVLLGLVDIGHLAKGIIAVGILAGMMSLLIKSLKGAQNVKGALIVMTVAIAVLAGAIAGLSFIDPKNLASATIAMSAVIGVFALLIKAAKSLKGVGSIIAPLTLMVGVVVILAGVITALSLLKVDVALQTTAGLSSLMLSMSASLFILSKIGTFTKNALLGVLALTAMAVPLVAFVGVLALMQNVQNATANVMALTILVTAMTLLLIPLTSIGAFGTAGLPFLGVLALTAMVVPLLAFVSVLALMQNIQNATANATLLIALVTTMTAVLIALSIVGPLALVGVYTLTAMSKLMLALGVVAVAIGALMEKFPAIQRFLDTGIPVLVQLAGGIGKMIGVFVGGIMTEIASTLPTIGTCLSQFMVNATGFINGAKMVDETVLKGVGVLAGAILALTAADLIAGVVSLLQGGTSFATLGTELSMFMTNASGFILGAKMIDPAIMTGVKTLAEAIIILTGANLIEGISRFLGGSSSLASFGSQLGSLGTNMKTFVTNLGTFSEEQVTTVNCAGKAIKALADAASTIPNEGGWVAAIVGENSLANFGSQLGGLATNLKTFVTNLGTFTKDQVTTVDCAGKAIKALAEAADEIPNNGGLWAAIVGDNSLATFGSKLPGLGSNLNSFITNLGTFGDDSIKTVDCAGKAIKALAEAAKTIPNEGGFWSKIVGDNSLATFGSKLPGLAKNIASFVSNLGTFGEGQIATVNSACKAIKAIAQLGKIDLGDTSSGIEKLGKKLGTFATKLSDFVNKMNEVGADGISSAVKKTKELIDLAKTAASANVESLSTFGKSLKSLAKDGVKGFVDELSKKSYKDDAKKAAEAIVKAFIKAMGDKEADVKKKGKTVAGKASTGISEAKLESKGKTAGKDLGKGLVNGIEAKYDAAYDAGYKLGQKAVQGEKDGQASNSPSKLTTQAGKWFGEGLIIGIERMSRAVYHSAYGLGETATTSISTAVSKITDLVNSDIDAQPTIRPVLDLSDVRAGAGSINGLFSGRTLAVNLAGVGAVSASMSNRQNGGNSDVVTAIKGLRKDIANMPRNTYSFGDMTVEEGSDVAEGMKAIVRAMKVEGRA